MTTCRDCAAPITQPAGRGHPRVFCAACVVRRNAKYMRKLRAACSPEERATLAQARREYALQKNYGLGVAEFDAMLAAQGGTCAVATCTRTHNKNGSALNVDHDHRCCPSSRSCGKCVRWLLCTPHNAGIGMFNDDPAELRAATDLLESWARGAS